MSYFVDSLGVMTVGCVPGSRVRAPHWSFRLLLSADKSVHQSGQGDDADHLIEFFKGGLEQDDEEVQAICLNSLLFMLNIRCVSLFLSHPHFLLVCLSHSSLFPIAALKRKIILSGIIPSLWLLTKSNDMVVVERTFQALNKLAGLGLWCHCCL